MLVEDNPVLRAEIGAVLSANSINFAQCGTMHEAVAALQGARPDLLLLDFALPDGDASQLLKVTRANRQASFVIGMSGCARPVEAFSLSHLGVRLFLEKPFTAAELESAIRQVQEACHSDVYLPMIRQAVGQAPLHEIESGVRTEILREAHRRTGGNRRAMGRLLGVSRQVVQHMLRKLDDISWNSQ